MTISIGRVKPLGMPRANPADAAEATLRIAGHALLDDQPAFAVLALDQARRPIAVLWVGVFVPEVERLQDVTISIDDIVSPKS